MDEALFFSGISLLVPRHAGGGFLPRWGIVALGIACAWRAERFSNLDPSDAYVRFGFGALVLCGCGLLMAEVLRNRRLSLEAQE